MTLDPLTQASKQADRQTKEKRLVRTIFGHEEETGSGRRLSTNQQVKEGDDRKRRTAVTGQIRRVCCAERMC